MLKARNATRMTGNQSNGSPLRIRGLRDKSEKSAQGTENSGMAKAPRIVCWQGQSHETYKQAAARIAAAFCFCKPFSPRTQHFHLFLIKIYFSQTPHCIFISLKSVNYLYVEQSLRPCKKSLTINDAFVLYSTIRIIPNIHSMSGRHLRDSIRIGYANGIATGQLARE